MLKLNEAPEFKVSLFSCATLRAYHTPRRYTIISCLLSVQQWSEVVEYGFRQLLPAFVVDNKEGMLLDRTHRALFSRCSLTVDLDLATMQRIFKKNYKGGQLPKIFLQRKLDRSVLVRLSFVASLSSHAFCGL
jgi:hypothetical protein